MMKAFQWLDIFRGKTLTIPPFDGPLQPNNRLEDAPAWAHSPHPDNLVADGERVLFSSGLTLYQLPDCPDTLSEPLFTFPHSIVSLVSRPGGGVVAGLDDGTLWLFEEGDAHPFPVFAKAIRCPTALLFLDRNRLAICVGSSVLPASEWPRDLLSHNRNGSVWLVDIAQQRAERLAHGLSFPNGIVAGKQPDTLLVSESWQYRVISLSLRGGDPRVVLDRLPAYPSRLSVATGGGYWLTCFAPRNRLVEFILREKAYRHAMLAEVVPEFWIAPALSSGNSFLEPLQCGGVKTMGIHKPWSPSRSWGLVIRLDENAQPIHSYHSRADGKRHGINSVLDTGHHVWVASRGGNVIIELNSEVAHG